MKKLQKIVGCIAMVACALGFSLWARYGLIESVTVATQCNATTVPLQCTVRGFVIASTAFPLWGYLAAAAGTFALFLRRLDLSVLALMAGAAGLVLYSGAPAAVGLMLGWITLARLIVGENAAREQ